MKKQIVLLTLSTLCTFAGHFANAAVDQQWQGTGVALTPSGKELETYTSLTTVSEIAPGILQSIAELTFADGKHKQISMKITLKNNSPSFQLDSNLGPGVGACYGAGLCESYIDSGRGLAFSTTSIQDSKETRRALTIELKEGKAVRVLRETLVLKK